MVILILKIIIEVTKNKICLISGENHKYTTNESVDLMTKI
jgi:hypothetical protein